MTTKNKWFSQAAALTVAALGAGLPESFEVADANLHEYKGPKGDGQITNYRLGFVLANEELCLSVPMLERKTDTQDGGKKGEWVLNPLLVVNKNPVYSANLWFGTAGFGEDGTDVIGRMPIHPIQKFIENVGKQMVDPEFVKYLRENKQFYTTRPVDLGGGRTERLECIVIPYNEIPEDLREITCLGTVDPKTKIVSFDARRDTFCFGTQPNNLGPAQGSKFNRVVGGQIPNPGGTQSKKVVDCLQKTVDEAFKAILTAKKVESVKVEYVPESRSSAAKSEREQLLEMLGTGDVSHPALPPVTEKNTVVSGVEEEVSFDDSPAQA